MIHPFIIFAQDRTGSTTLFRLVNCHPAIRCVFEPFSPRNVTPYAAHCETLRLSHGVEAALQWLWRGCNGIKHVWKYSGWPCVDSPDLNRRIMLSGATIILLSRRNALRRAISGQISEQMGIWFPTSADHMHSIRSHLHQPLDIPRLKAEMQAATSSLAEVRATLTASPVRWREWTYEDFFSPHLSLDAQCQALQELFDFIGVPSLKEQARLESIRELFNPAATGFQNDMAYHKIPNISEVEQTLGTHETGFVFDSSQTALDHHTDSAGRQQQSHKT